MKLQLTLLTSVLLTLSPHALAASELSDQLRKEVALNDGWSTDTRTLLQKNVDTLSALAGMNVLLEPHDSKALPPGTVTIGVVRSDKLERIAALSSSRHVKRVLNALEGNALAIPPDLILLDEQFVAELIAYVYFDVIGFTESMLVSMSAVDGSISTEEAELRVTVLGVVGDYRRYRLLRQSRTENDSESAPVRIDEYIDIAVGTFEISGFFELVLAPVILHELGHLKSGEQGGLFEDWIEAGVSAYREWKASRRLSLEVAADEYALGKISSLLRSIWSREDVPDLDKLVKTQALVSVGKFMRDVVVLDALDGFRGLKTEELMLKLDHRACDLDVPRESSILLDVNHIVSADRRYFPVLTQAEFDGLRERTRQRVQNGSHPHHFLRVNALFDLIGNQTPFPVDSSWLGQPGEFLAAMYNNEPSKLSVPLAGTGIGISVDDLLSPWGRELSFQQGVNCPKGMCGVAYTRDIASFKAVNLDAFIEFLGPRSNPFLLRVVIPMFGTSTNDRDQVESGDDAALASFLQALGSIMRLFINLEEQHILPQERTSSSSTMDSIPESTMEVIELFITLRELALRCGAVSSSSLVGDRVVSIRTLNSQGLWEIEVTAQ